MPAITFDVVVLATFTNSKLHDDPMCIPVAMPDILAVFVFERTCLGKRLAASDATGH